ncbi:MULTISPECIES: hypothetical protein [unclassified Meiothermus]|uniref:hypothetical protein n=1 Tax=unclassified Meiothermus TaxID=370471 RepID=UPI000D7D1391|nr:MULTISPECIES: hypothetical protein [unclassified Meiothermus]PZA07276.1 hypothetical protein DNA98_08710 [Meiothermus sp. Pnk-1]RYM38010.1 hypothetical protein EWH23_05370 [Meiothermus sp. PNK-Is4]
MRSVTLPNSVAEALERFKKERGRGWSRELISLLRAELEREQARQELGSLLREIRAQSGLSEREVYQKLR